MALTPTTDLPLGFKAPHFQLPNAIDGAMLSSLELMQGGPTVVMFICNHCPFVVHLLDGLVAFGNDMKARGVNVIAISSNDINTHPQDDFPLMKALAEERHFPFPYLYDESQEVARAYDAACTPDFSVFDANQQCVYRGQFDASRPGNGIPVTGHDLRAVVNTLLDGREVSADGQVPSMGCNIKWK
ncbi:MAG: thioredoxin family protein [Bacteroidetes bacterium]|jgi:peroxiredoxin|nr:thioredoxin family protein [Bacteroidota bacterium]